MVASVIHAFDDIELIYLNQLVTLLFNDGQLIKPIDGLVCMSLEIMFVPDLLEPFIMVGMASLHESVLVLLCYCNLAGCVMFS